MKTLIIGALQRALQPVWVRGEHVLHEGAKHEELYVKVQHPISEITS